MEGETSVFRRIPGVGALLEHPQVKDLCLTHPRSVVTAALGRLTGQLREELRRGRVVEDAESWLLSRLPGKLIEIASPLRRVLNATGVVLHTNLGRAPLAPAALEAIEAVVGGYCNLEFDLHEGTRGSRYGHAVDLLRLLTGAEDALVVNNNAAAVLLCLEALARGKQVVVSRGELVEIGGGFRVPEIMAQSGATLVEVGTTNRTRLQDYEQALGPEVAMLLKVHRSNFRLEGFTEEVDWRELAALGQRHQLPTMFDLGSGCLFDLADRGIGKEPVVRAVVAAGGDLVTFSGDKLLGGPQAGIILGRKELVARMRRHPLLRALRVDKLTLAALSATLLLYLDEEHAAERVPALAALTLSPDQLNRRAHRLRRLIAGRLAAEREERGEISLTVMPERSPAGGGSLPGVELATYVVAIRTPREAGELAATLRLAPVPLVARVKGGQVLLDVRTLFPPDLPLAAEMVAWALSALHV